MAWRVKIQVENAVIILQCKRKGELTTTLGGLAPCQDSRSNVRRRPLHPLLPQPRSRLLHPTLQPSLNLSLGDFNIFFSQLLILTCHSQ